jgi:Transglutaminase-like superfamily
MALLVLRAYCLLLLFDAYLARRNFGALYAAVKNCACNERKPLPNPVQRVCFAVDVASIWYWKKILCLQRSAATACLLKRYGVPAKMVIGTQATPFKAHAWVEVDGRVVNDKPYTPELYAEIARC